MKWDILKEGKELKLKNPILIEGLPGIGNVGKIAVDFIIDECKGKRIATMFSHSMPHSVFVSEENVIEMPRIEFYVIKTKTRDLLLLSGDFQPTSEESCYLFSETVLSYAKSLGVKEAITLGGIGLQVIPEKPKLYCAGTSKDYIDKFRKGTHLRVDTYTAVGPIVGVSGLIVGLCPKYDFNGVVILSETFSHPLYLGIKGAKEMLILLDHKFKFNLDMKKIEKEIKDLENEINKTNAGLDKVSKTKLGRIKRFVKETNYIG